MQLNALVALRNRNYRWFWISSAGTSAAQGIQQLAVAWLVLDLTGSVGQLGLVIFLQGAPMSLVSLFGGVLADRYSRRNLLMISQFITGLNLVILASLTISGAVQIWQVYVSSMVLGVMLSVTMPARTAMVWNLVSRDELQNAIALNSMQLHASRIVWPTLAGGLVSLAGVGPTLILSSCASGVGIVALSLLRNVVEVRKPATTSPLAAAADGIRYILRTPRVRGLLSLSLAPGAFGLAFMSVAPGFAREVMGLSAGETGLFVMASGLGALIGSGAMVVIDLGNRMRVLALSYGLFCGTVLLLAVNPVDVLGFGLMAMYGLVLGALSVAGQTLFQRTVQPDYLGRVVSIWSMAGAMGFLFALPVGVAGDLLGLRWALGGGAAVLVTYACWRAWVFSYPPYSGTWEEFEPPLTSAEPVKAS